MKKYILLIMGAICLTGCNEPAPNGGSYVFFRSYIARYIDVNEFRVFSYNKGCTFSFMTGDLTMDTPVWSYSSKDKDKKEFYDQLCRKNNDMTFNRKLPCPSEPGIPRHNALGGYLAFDIVSINFVSDTDFDKDHPAGSSLNDLVKLQATTAYRYIQSGYGDDVSFMIDKFLSELEPDDLKLLGHYTQNVLGIFYFTYLPDIIREHNLIVTITLEDDRTFEIPVKVEIWDVY